MMCQAPVLLGILWLLLPSSFAESEVNGKDSHQVYSYTYHIQHNGSADPRQFLQSVLPDPPEGGSAVRTFFNPHIRGFISKGYLPAGPLNSRHGSFTRPQRPSLQQIRNVVEQNLRNFPPPPSPPEFAPFHREIDNPIPVVNNEIGNNLFSDGRGHGLFRNEFPRVQEPIIPEPVLPRPVVPPPPPPPLSPEAPPSLHSPPEPLRPALPPNTGGNDGVVTNVRTFEKDLPDGKIYEKIETYSYNPRPVSNFVTRTEGFNGGNRQTQQFNSQTQRGYGYRTTSYFRKEHRTATPPALAPPAVGNAVHNDPQGTGGQGIGGSQPWNGGQAGRNQGHFRSLNLLLKPSVDGAHKDSNPILNNNIDVGQQQGPNIRPVSVQNHRSPGGFGLRLNSPPLRVNLPVSHPRQFNQRPPTPGSGQGFVNNNAQLRQPDQHFRSPAGHSTHNSRQNHQQSLNLNLTPDPNRGVVNNVDHDVTSGGQRNVDYNSGNGGTGHNYGAVDNTADRIINTVNNKLRGIEEELNGISGAKPGGGSGGGQSAFPWDDRRSDWNRGAPRLQWGNRLPARAPEKLPADGRPFSNGHSGPNQRPVAPGNDGGVGDNVSPIDVLRHTLEALVGRRLEIPVLPVTGSQDGNTGSGGVERTFIVDKVIEGPNSYSRDQRRGFERNFQVNRNTGYQRTNQWSTDTSRKLDAQSTIDDFRRDFIDVFAEDV